MREKAEPPNKRMQLTKLRAAPVLRAEVPPCAPAGETGGGTASQLIRGVRRTCGECTWARTNRCVNPFPPPWSEWTSVGDSRRGPDRL